MNDSVKPERLSVADRLATLPPEVQQLFANPEHGTPDNISKAGCLALAKLGKDAWNAWREAFPVTGEWKDYHNTADFSGFDFRSDPVDFAGFVFGDDANFAQTLWGNEANFVEAQWGYDANFFGARWEGVVSFMGTQWGEGANFVDAQWCDVVSFCGSYWEGHSEFIGAEWLYNAMFTDAVFIGGANFTGARIGKVADFSGVIWGSKAIFDGVRFESHVYFGDRKDRVGGDEQEDLKQALAKCDITPESFHRITFAGASFEGVADFSNRKFLLKTSFDCLQYCIKRDEAGRIMRDENGMLIREFDQEQQRHVIFSKPPIFHGCELHQDTSFDGAEFPPATGSDEAARAYRTLKLAFSKQQALREEQRFFRLEMAEEAKSSGKAQPLYWLYRVSSDYGFSLWRPFVAFLVLLLVFAQVYGYYSNELPSCWLLESACESSTKWYEFSLAQALPFSGFDKLDNFKDGVVSLFKDVPVLVLALHKALSLAALFLMGLALRNLFRLK